MSERTGLENTPAWVAWQQSIQRRMAVIDALPQKMRLVIHEYGWEPVKLLMDLGVKSPQQVEHIIRAIRGSGQAKEDRVS